MVTTAEILQLEQQRADAMIKADGPALERLFDDELVWTHSSAKVDSKKSFIDTVAGRTNSYKSIEIEDHVVRLHGDFAIATGVASMQAVVSGQDKAMRNRFTAVWAKRGPNWRMMAWQSTPSPKS